MHNPQILVIGIRIGKIGFLAVDGIRIHVRTGRCSILKEHGQHAAQGMLTTDIIFVSGQAGISVETPPFSALPVVRECVAEDSAFSEPVAVPVASTVHADGSPAAGRRRVRGRRYAARLRAACFPGHFVNLKNDFGRRLYDRLLVIYLRSRISRSGSSISWSA